MNRSEHLLTCLSEECAKVQKAVAKAQRFGLSNYHPEKAITNAQEIAKECCDVIAIIEMLEEEGIIEKSGTLQAIEGKKIRVNAYMAVAKECGTLTD